MADGSSGWFALAGAAIGALPSVAGAVTGLFKARSDRKHQQAEKLRDERRTQIADWRAGLAESHSTYQRWWVDYNKDIPSRTFVVPPDKPIGAAEAPDAVGTVWFASLRPHISPTGPAAGLRNAVVLNCGNENIVALQNEISRIEKAWLASPKLRNRLWCRRARAADPGVNQ